MRCTSRCVSTKRQNILEWQSVPNIIQINSELHQSIKTPQLRYDSQQQCFPLTEHVEWPPKYTNMPINCKKCNTHTTKQTGLNFKIKKI